MRRACALLLLLIAAGPTPPKRLLHELLLAECRAKFAARATEVEALKTPADVAARQDRLRK
ncbi:MAG TPA: hypothetical protein VD866_13220, partial [Urbifossiella sp.]|nr:hypothetical protein [Urbifossiella sp.]